MNSRGIGNVLPIRPIGDEDWKLAIFGRYWAVDVAADGEMAIFEGYGNVLLEDEAIFVVGVD